MSEVALKAAYGAYRKWASSDSLEDLYESVVKGQAEDGHTITHIYSFIDDLKDVQLFYCRDGNHGDLKTSRHVRKLRLLWRPGKKSFTPRYLKRAYAEVLAKRRG